MRAEDNAEWIRDKITEHGLTDWIAQAAHTRYLARYATQRAIDDMFYATVKELA